MQINITGCRRVRRIHSNKIPRKRSAEARQEKNHWGGLEKREARACAGRL